MIDMQAAVLIFSPIPLLCEPEYVRSGIDVCTELIVTYRTYRDLSLAPSFWCLGSLRPKTRLDLNQRSEG